MGLIGINPFRVSVRVCISELSNTAHKINDRIESAHGDKCPYSIPESLVCNFCLNHHLDIQIYFPIKEMIAQYTTANDLWLCYSLILQCCHCSH